MDLSQRCVQLVGNTDIVTIIAILWVVGVSFIIIRKERIRGLFILVLTAGAALVSVLGEKFGYDGDIMAIILAGMILAGLFFHDKNVDRFS